jgi:hypothetical protein
MPQQLPCGQTWNNRRAQALRLLCLLAVGISLAGCGRCGDFWSWSQGQIGACRSDAPRQ